MVCPRVTAQVSFVVMKARSPMFDLIESHSKIHLQLFTIAAGMQRVCIRRRPVALKSAESSVAGMDSGYT